MPVASEYASGNFLRGDRVFRETALYLVESTGENRWFGYESCRLHAYAHEGGFNIVKASVGTINIFRGTIGTASGVTLITGVAITTPLIGPLSAPASVIGAGQLAFGVSNLKRGALQLSESLNDKSGSSARNLLGLLPFGQKFDDVGEPSPFEYFGAQIERFVTDPYDSTKQLLKDFFVVE